MFDNFATILNYNFQEIINFFVCIESFNRIPKDTKRNYKGYLDFEHARNKILFAIRKNASIFSPKKQTRGYEN